MKKKEAPSEGGEWTRHRIQKTNLSLISMGRSGDNHCSIDIVNILIIIGQQISNLGGWLDECLRSIPVLECIRTARFQIFRISLAPADCRLSHRQDEPFHQMAVSLLDGGGIFTCCSVPKPRETSIAHSKPLVLSHR
jgi:hypothetical protein